MKIGVIGGGSSYTPELLEGLLDKQELLGIDTICLMDIDSKRLAILGALGRRMMAKAGKRITITTTESLEEAVRGASFVISQFRAGGMAARIGDEKLGLQYGLIGQETTGIGGFAKSLRTIPILLQVTQAIEKYAPEAWLINFTNPSGIITEAALKYSQVKVIGLCNIPIGYIMMATTAFQVTPDRIALDSVGLNHLSWVRGLQVDGVERLPEFAELVAKEFEGEIEPSNQVMAHWTRFHRMIPSYYLRYYYCTDQVLEELRNDPQTRGEKVVEVEKILFAKYADPHLAEKPKELEERGGAYYSTAAVNLIESLITDKGDVQVVNVRNQGTLSELPSEVVIEVPCRITARGAVPLPQRPLEPEIRGYIQVVKAYEELTVEAGATRNRRAALLAMSVHPLIRNVAQSEELFLKINEHACWGECSQQGV